MQVLERKLCHSGIPTQLFVLRSLPKSSQLFRMHGDMATDFLEDLLLKLGRSVIFCDALTARGLRSESHTHIDNPPPARASVTPLELAGAIAFNSLAENQVVGLAGALIDQLV